MNAIHQYAEIGPDRMSLRFSKPLPKTVPCGTAQVEIRFISMPQLETPDEDETGHLLKSSSNSERLLKSIDDIEHGRNIVSFDSLEDALKAAEGRA